MVNIELDIRAYDDNLDLDQFLNNMKRIRAEKGVSINMISRATKISPNTIHRIETGKSKNPGIKTVYKILKVLGEEDVSIKDLVC